LRFFFSNSLTKPIEAIELIEKVSDKYPQEKIDSYINKLKQKQTDKTDSVDKSEDKK